MTLASWRQHPPCEPSCWLMTPCFRYKFFPLKTIGSCDALAVVAMSRSSNPIPARHGISGIATTCLPVGTSAVVARQSICRHRGPMCLSVLMQAAAAQHIVCRHINDHRLCTCRRIEVIHTIAASTHTCCNKLSISMGCAVNCKRSGLMCL